MPAHGPSALITLSVALLFVAIFLFGGRAAYRPGQRGRRRFLSFAAGISVGYTFVHVLPGLIMEAIPGLYVFPFWVLVVGAVIMWGPARPKMDA
ncbi:hypothetical protein MUP29_12765 [bacterium]|nr:hypothetical protein [bacterium]